MLARARGRLFSCVCRVLTAVTLLSAGYALPSSATTITYEPGTNRPTQFVGVEVDFGAGLETYDVAVTWDQTFIGVYGSDVSGYASDPRLIAWDDSSRADTAITALKSALVADAASNTTGTSYLEVAHTLQGGDVVRARGVDLFAGPSSPTLNVDTFRTVSYGTVGFTEWQFSSVPEPSTALLMTLALALCHVRRQR